MSDDNSPGLLDWLALRRNPDFSKARWLGAGFSALGGLTVALLFVLAVAAAFKLLGAALFKDLLAQPGAALGVGGVTVALIGAPFVIWRSIVAQKSVNVEEQGQITDRINTAAQGLGAEKTIKRAGSEEETVPNIEVRIGALFALERIMQDSARDYFQILEILCAYIRQNAQTVEEPLPEGDPSPAEWPAWTEEAVYHLRLDVDVALSVIERRSAEGKAREKVAGYHLGLERAPLRKLI